MLDRSWPAQVREQRWMDIYAAIARQGEDARRHEKAKGYGDDEVYGGGRCPTRECIKCMGG